MEWTSHHVFIFEAMTTLFDKSVEQAGDDDHRDVHLLRLRKMISLTTPIDHMQPSRLVSTFISQLVCIKAHHI
jgi:hypothetical protein